MKKDMYWEKIKGRKRQSFYSYPETIIRDKRLVEGKGYIVVLEGIKKVTLRNPKGQTWLYVKSREDAKKLSGILKKVM